MRPLNFLHSEAAIGGVLLKKVFYRFRKIHGKIPVSESLFQKVASVTCKFMKKYNLVYLVFRELCKIFKKHFFTEHLP